MSTKTIVLLHEENDGNYGELTLFDTLREAELHIEGLLEKGYDSRSIRLLEGCERDFVVRHRPVVSALPVDGAAAVAAAQSQVEAAEGTPQDTTAETRAAETALIAVGLTPDDRPDMRDGVRFSSTFAGASRAGS